MPIILFEDEGVARLAPVALGKPAFAISCGGYRLIDLLAEFGEPMVAFVRPHLVELAAADYPLVAPRTAPPGPALFVNARLTPSLSTIKLLRDLIALKSAAAVRVEGGVAAAFLPECPAIESWKSAESVTRYLAGANLANHEATPSLFAYAHDVVRHHLTILSQSLAHRVAKGGYREVDTGLFVAKSAKISEYIVVDTSPGPIVIDEEASIGPHAYLSGPLYIGPKVRVLEHASLKMGVSVGHTCKIGGEVEASIIEPYTNKQHHGFLGHSYLGSWVNLGAGTCNSDLKNTYGLVNVEVAREKIATGMQFLGATIGDYAKTAINTGIFTGKTIGVCSMVYGFVTTNVPSFVNYARLFGQVTEAPVEVMISTQQRMFARRGVTQRPCDIQLLRDMHRLTVAERSIPGEQIPIEPLSL